MEYPIHNLSKRERNLTSRAHNHNFGVLVVGLLLALLDVDVGILLLLRLRSGGGSFRRPIETGNRSRPFHRLLLRLRRGDRAHHGAPRRARSTLLGQTKTWTIDPHLFQLVGADLLQVRSGDAALAQIIRNPRHELVSLGLRPE